MAENELGRVWVFEPLHLEPTGEDWVWRARYACPCEDKLLRCAQALRLIRDTSSGVNANLAGRALTEAGIEDPDDGVEGGA